MAEDLTRVLTDLVGAKLDGLTKEIEQMKARHDGLSERVDELSRTSGFTTGKAEAAAMATLQSQVQRLLDVMEGKAEVAATERLEQKVGDIREKMQLMDKMIDVKLEVMSDTAKKIQMLHDTITETAVSARHSVELERLRVQLQRLGGVVSEVQPEITHTVRRGLWSRFCGCERRQRVAVDRRFHLSTAFPQPEKLAGKSSSSSSSSHMQQHDDPKLQMRPQDILRDVLTIEMLCKSPEVDEADGLAVDRLVDEPTFKYCTCSSPDSPSIISCLWTVYEDVSLDTVKRALLSVEERTVWDCDADFKILRRADQDDPLSLEVVSFVWHAPWPFWDRDVLQSRYQLPLSDGAREEGSAIVMRSVTDEQLLPEQTGRVRAFVTKGAFLLRPLKGGRGVQLTSCSQVDIGGIVPQWAQNFLTRLAVQQADAWKEKLREHCLTMASRAG